MVTSGHISIDTIEEFISKGWGLPKYKGKIFFTSEEMDEFVETLFQGLNDYYDIPDNTQARTLTRTYLQTRVGEQVISETEVELYDNENHEPWLNEQSTKIKWDLWNCYYRWMSEEQHRSPNVLASLENSIDKALDAIESPAREGSWERKGLILGHVQSGKTQHYIGLINKALDAGYQFIIVLTGMTNDLRSQTQIRFDEGVYGWESDEDNENHGQTGIGAHSQSICLLKQSVNELKKHQYLNVLTYRSHHGDFSRAKSSSHAGPLSDNPYIFVVKKNKAVLNNLYGWLKRKLDESQQQITRPLLLIDDEADYASINTNPVDTEKDPIDAENDLTAINLGIRKLLNIFSKRAYIAYTATPYANALIRFQDNEADLFPRHFMLQTPTPDSYVGADRVFGLREDPDNYSEPESGWGPLGIVRWILDDDHYGPIRKDTLLKPQLPKSMKTAIQSFLISCAVRTLRGQENDHKSMLIHVTLNTYPQAQIADQVENYKTELKNALKFGGDLTILEELESLWINECQKTIEWNRDKHGPEYAAFVTPTWKEVSEKILDESEKTRVLEINGTSKDAIMYKDFPKGLSVIAVGGNKLSRGLTLEGLTVSYFLRMARAGDTLLQMGRWFGYKPGYIDLCRVYTHHDIHEDFLVCALNEIKMREDLDTMTRLGLTPTEFCIRMAKDPNNRITLTAMNKMKNAKTVNVSFSSQRAQQFIYSREKQTIDHNYSTLLQLINTADKEAPSANKILYRNLSSDAITTFLNDLELPPHKHQIQTQAVIHYIQGLNLQQELTEWNVLLVGGDTKSKQDVNGDNFTLAHRHNDTPKLETYRIKTLVSNMDELLDLSQEKRKRVESAAQTIVDKKSSNGAKKPDIYSYTSQIVRGVETEFDALVCRERSNGLLMVYLVDPESAQVENTKNPIVAWCISFPQSLYNTKIEEQFNFDHITAGNLIFEGDEVTNA